MTDLDTGRMRRWSLLRRRRVCYLPKTHLLSYSDPTEPRLYPNKYAALAVLQPGDTVIGPREFKKLLENHTHKREDGATYVDSAGIFQELFNTKEDPFNDRS